MRLIDAEKGVGIVNTVKKRLTTKGAVFSARFGGAGGIGCSLTISAPTANERKVRNVNLHLP